MRYLDLADANQIQYLCPLPWINPAALCLTDLRKAMHQSLVTWGKKPTAILTTESNLIRIFCCDEFAAMQKTFQLYEFMLHEFQSHLDLTSALIQFLRIERIVEAPQPAFALPESNCTDLMTRLSIGGPGDFVWLQTPYS